MAKKTSVNVSKNPRGETRPHDGRGGGKGMAEGARGGQNTSPCKSGGPGYGNGAGQGQGTNR